MIDIHSHILYELDDGSRSFEESVEMLEMAVSSGTTDIVATPHANRNFQFVPELVTERIERLQAHMGDRIRIHPGCDFHLDFENVEDALLLPSKYTINHKNYLLIELADFVYAKMVDGIVDKLLQRGLTPIVTHPERNPMVMSRVDDLAAWVERGCLIQVTAGSVLGGFGRTAKQHADHLLKRKLVHFIASDAHNTQYRTTKLDEAYQFIAGREGQSTADRLFRENAAAVLAGEYLNIEEVVPARSSKSRKWYEFWR